MIAFYDLLYARFFILFSDIFYIFINDFPTVDHIVEYFKS